MSSKMKRLLRHDGYRGCRRPQSQNRFKKLGPLICLIVLIFANGELALATHSNNGECGTGHLGDQEDCSGTPSSPTVDGAPAPTIGSVTGSMSALLLATAIIIVLRRKNSRIDRTY